MYHIYTLDSSIVESQEIISNPWMVQSIQDFNFFCCPECVYRTKEEISFQAHAIQNHEQSKNFFHNSIQVKKEVNLSNELF